MFTSECNCCFQTALTLGYCPLERCNCPNLIPPLPIGRDRDGIGWLHGVSKENSSCAFIITVLVVDWPKYMIDLALQTVLAMPFWKILSTNYWSAIQFFADWLRMSCSIPNQRWGRTIARCDIPAAGPPPARTGAEHSTDIQQTNRRIIGCCRRWKRPLPPIGHRAG